ncbi:MAG: 2-succinyl-5-enolpyruvyl-6-hydroxy-3-cyclohexene-1-carboxylic-acid synthase [Crocinitomicaceae bacterium]|nr:2-succinyl-5-enolpyruvyl-6-hydroxy-3-cyclohexene-1-carboxylic-acid synthase [Crocinitomicaceae bacterium]|tara:strand:- start:10009 stop:11688 length:1680 start_codon:yes stop_codon:yes gene_type:complete
MTSKENAYLIANLFTKKGGTHVVISPGSRNAPLIKAFQDLNGVTCYSIVDERCAGFYGLGIAIATGKAVALVCTSGTALLNYSPAIAEAFYLGAPLVVMSADRPLDRIDTGEGQTIQQSGVYHNFQKGFLNVPEDVLNNYDIIVKSSDLFDTMLKGKPGPIHFNLPLSEPLYEESVGHSDINNKLLSLSDQKLKVVRGTMLSNELIHVINSKEKKLILCGNLGKSESLIDQLENLNKREDITVLFESISNLHTGCGIATIDRTLSAGTTKELKPELVVTLGEHVISKKIKQLLKNTEALTHIHVSDSGHSYDTFQSDHKSQKMDKSDFLEQILRSLKDQNSDYSSRWEQSEINGRKLHNEFMQRVPFCDLSVFNKVLSTIPAFYHLQSGNSSVIRYIQLFEFNQWKHCHANRGTCGIDGSTSTAIGYSTALKEPTVLITGDISFLYDSNGLWNDSIRSDFRIIVVNNQGGGIFRFIPGPDSVPNHEKFFETNHKLDIEPLSRTFGFSFDRVCNEKELEISLKTFFNDSRAPKILEIRTPREQNAEVLKQYFSFIESKRV